MLSYIEELAGTPYVWWKDGESTIDKMHPFYAKPGSVPDTTQIKKLGTNCAGLINLICRKFNVPVPGVDKKDYYAGGTYSWYQFLQEKDKLQDIDEIKIYPIGTLLLSPYIDPENQGHLAIVTCSGTIQTLKISHSYPINGVVMNEEIEFPHSYSVTCDIQDWLNPSAFQA